MGHPAMGAGVSIWCSWEPVGHEDGDKRGGDVRSYAQGWSNHYPTTDGQVEKPCHVGIAHIPTWCVPGHRDADSAEDDPLGPWVRLDVVTYDHERGKPVGGPWAHSVVMDEGAARQLAADLLAWADMEKVQPKDEA